MEKLCERENDRPEMCACGPSEFGKMEGENVQKNFGQKTNGRVKMRGSMTNVVTHQFVTNAIEALELLNKVDSFYNNAWQKLIVYGALLVGVVGIIFPLLVQWFQTKVWKAEQRTLEGKLEEVTKGIELRVQQRITEMFKSESDKIDGRLKQFQDEEKVEHAKNWGSILYLQARFAQEQNRQTAALLSFINAANVWVGVKKENMLQKCLDTIGSILQEMSKAELAKDPEVPKRLENLLDRLRESNPDKRYTNHLRMIRHTLATMPEQRAETGEGE